MQGPWMWIAGPGGWPSTLNQATGVDASILKSYEGRGRRASFEETEACKWLPITGPWEANCEEE